MARVQFRVQSRVAKLHFAHSSPAHYLSKTSCEHLCCLRLVSASLAFDSHSVPSGSSRYIAAAMLLKHDTIYILLNYHAQPVGLQNTWVR